jgi:hypothetical protein
VRIELKGDMGRVEGTGYRGRIDAVRGVVGGVCGGSEVMEQDAEFHDKPDVVQPAADACGGKRYRW